MTLKVEWVYTDTGTELTTGLLSTAITTPQAFLYDGRYMWLACNEGVAIYEFWGESSNNEPAWETLSALEYPGYNQEYNQTKKLKMVAFVNVSSSQIKRSTRHPSLSLRPEIIDTTPDGSTTVSGVTVTLTTKTNNLKVITEVGPNASGIALTPKYMAKVADKVYVAGASFQHIFEFDVDTLRLTQVINLPIRVDAVRQAANSNLVSAGGKLWFVNTFFNDVTPQRLYCHVPGAADVTFTNIPNRPSTSVQYLADGKNGHIYLANFNDVSVGKYLTSNGVYVANIRTNAFPTGIWSDENRRIFVNSFAGMLTLVDWDDDGVHNEWSTDDAKDDNVKLARALATDPTDASKVWWVDSEKIVRYDLNTNEQLESFVEAKYFVGDINNGASVLSAGATLASGSAAVIGGYDVTLPAAIPLQQTAAAVIADEEGIPVSLPDWVFSNSALTAEPKVLHITYPQTYGSTSVLPYVFVAYAGKLCALRLDTYLFYRESFSEVYGQAAVVAGAEEYFGEV